MALPWVEMKKEEEYGIKTNVVPWDEVSQQNIQSNASQPYPILKSAPIQEEEEDTMLKRISRLILPRSLEIKLGITKPNDWDIMMQNEDGRMSYIREKQFTELYKKEIKESPVVPKEYKEPTGFFGQFLEGIQTGYISSIKGGFGYFVESMGRIASNPERLQWGAKLGDMATIELIKRPELLEPEDLKPFFEGGLIDRRWWGRRIGETLPFIGSTIAFATLGGLVGGPGGAVAGGLSSSATIEKGNSYKRYVDSGVPPDKADIYSTVYGLIAGTIENTLGVSPAKIGTKIATKGFERAVYNNYKEYLIKEIPKVGIETIKNSLTEGGEEVAQGIAENLILKFYRTETPVFTKDLLEEFASGFAASFPWGATNIRIPDIKKKNSAEIKTIEQSIKKADEVLQKQVVPTEKVITPKGLEPLARKYGLTIEESSTLKGTHGQLPTDFYAQIKEIEEVKPKVKPEVKPTEITQPQVQPIEEARKYKSAEEATSIDRAKLTSPGTIENADEMKLAVKTKENAEQLKEDYLDQLIRAQKDIKAEGGRQTASTNALLRERDAKTALKTLNQIEEGLPTKSQLTDIWNKANKTNAEEFVNEHFRAANQTELYQEIRQLAREIKKPEQIKKAVLSEFGTDPEITLYRGTSKDLRPSPFESDITSKVGRFWTPNKAHAELFARENGKIYELKIRASDLLRARLNKQAELSVGEIRLGNELQQTAKESLTKSQLIDFYNQAIKGAKEVKPKTTVKKFPENKYKLNLLEEIGGREELTKIEQDSFVWTPPTIGYNNPYTNVMKNAWNKIGKIWDSKAPLILKEAQTKEISQLLKERQRVYDGLSRKYYEDIINPLIKLSTKEKQKIGEMIFKRIDIPNEYERLIKDIDIKIGQLGQSIVNIDKELVKAGKLDKSMALLTEETWLSNLGEYSKTLYIKIKDGKSQIIPKSTITSEGVIDRSSFKRKLTDEEWGANSLMFEGKTKEEIETYTLEELKELGVSAKEKYGWVFQADYILARTFKDLSRAYATRLFQKEIVENPRLFTNNVKEATERGFIPVRDILPKGTEKDIRLGPINGGYINKGLQEELKMFLMGNNQDKINAIFQEPLSWWKAFRVAGNPPTVIRNFISGSTIQTDLAGYPVWTPKNSVRYIRAVKSYLSKDSLYEKLRDGGQYGSDYFSVEIEADEMSRIISRAEKSNNAMNTTTEDIVAIISEKSKDAKEIFNYYGLIDHMQRTYLASCALDDGATLPQAVHFANKWELDYRFVPLFVGSLRSGIAGWLYPFLSFYILMAPRIAEVLVTRPWVLVKYPIIIAMANTIAASMLGMDDDDIDNAKPEFLEENSYVVTMPTRDSNGDLQFLNLDYVFPFGGPSTLFIDWNQVLTMVKNPGMMGIVINILNNYDNFTEKKIYNETDLDEEKKKKISNYVVRNLGPGFVTHALNIWDASQGEIIGFPIKKERDMIQTIARSLGISVYSGGFNESFFKIKNLQEEINNIRWAMTTMMQDPKISTEEKQKNATLFQEKIRLRAEKIRDISDSISSQAQIEQKNKVIPWDEFTE